MASAQRCTCVAQKATFPSLFLVTLTLTLVLLTLEGSLASEMDYSEEKEHMRWEVITIELEDRRPESSERRRKRDTVTIEFLIRVSDDATFEEYLKACMQGLTGVFAVDSLPVYYQAAKVCHDSALRSFAELRKKKALNS